MATSGLYEATFRSLGEPAFVIDSDLRFVEVNAAFVQLTGLSRSETLGRSCTEVLGSDSCAASCPVKEALARQSRCRAVESLATKRGQAQFAVTAKFVEQPSWPGALATVILHDLTLTAGARMVAEAPDRSALPEISEMFRGLVEQSPLSILVIQDERVRFANARASQLLGLSAEALLDRPFQEFIHPDDRLAVAESHRSCLSGEPSPSAIELRAVSRGGEVRRVRSSAACIDWNKRRAALLLLAESCDDRSDGDAHRRSEAQFKALFDNVNDAIFIHDFEGNFLEVNAVACARLGYSREELLNMVIADINVSDQSSKVPKRLERLKREGHLVFETEHLRRDGTVIPTEINSRLYEYAGRPAMLSAARDTTERRRLTEEIIRAQKMESIGLLAGGVAHDFNNILGGILCLASLINRHAEDPDRCRAHSTMIEESVKQAAELTTRLLGLARQAPTHKRPVDLNKAVTDTLEIVSRTFPKAIKLEVNLAPDLPAVMGDDSQLAQAVMNLCLNARDAMPNGGTLTVTSDVRELTADEKSLLPSKIAEAGVNVVVRDTGHGISAEDKARIFEPFFTTKAPGKGTGLGLSTVHWVTKNHDGFCHVESEVGKGATFRLCMPAHAAAVASTPTRLREARGKGELVLVVDDDKTVRLACQATLEENGYNVLCAENGQEALELFRKHRGEVAIVVLDIIMPRMGGTTCLEELRKENPDVKVLMISGYDPGEHAELCSRGHAVYLQKPFGVDQLTDAVRSVLDDAGTPVP